jgi:sugar (pentulose or hexulose) kinase
VIRISKNYLLFDFGASNGRSAVAKYDGNKFDMEVTHRFENRPVHILGTLYWDILRLCSELYIGIQCSLVKHKNITSMGLNTWGADFGFTDSNGRLISNPVHYRDEKRKADADSLFKIISRKELFELTGAAIIPVFDLFHLYSLKLQNAAEFVNGDKFLTIPDIFNYFLTGKFYNEYTRMTTTVMYNQKENKLEDRIFDRLGLPKDIFGEIIMPGEKIGNISKNICSELGIETMPVIAPATHDTSSAVAGIPIVGENKNWAFISLGTWYIIGQEIKSPIINDQALSAGFSNEGGVGGINLFDKNTTGLWIIQQCRDKWLKERDSFISWDEIADLSLDAEPFKSFINVDDAIFSIHQADMPETIRKYCKEKGQKIPESISEISRCIYESLAMHLKYDFNNLEKLTGKKIELIHLIGGGARNKLLCQLISDATGVTVIAGPYEATSVGNLLMQLKASGEIKNLDEGRKISLNSSAVSSFEPKDIDRWDEEYSKYLKKYIIDS